MWKVFRANKKDTSKTKVNCCSTLVRFEQTLHLVWVLLWPFLKSKYMSRVVLAVFQCWYPHTLIMQPTAPLQKNSWQSYFKKFEVFFSRKERGAIRSDWKIYSCIFYHLCKMVTIFQVANLLSIFQQQYLLWHNTENRWKVIIYLPMLIET